MYKYKVLYPTLGKRILIDYNKDLFPGTSFVVYITCETLNECENIKKLMNSRLFKYLEHIFKSQRSPRDYIMRNLIKPSSFDIKITNNETIYKYFGLTETEIEAIETETLEDETTQISQKLQPNSTSQSAKIYNPLTDRYIKNTPTNQKKIEQLSLKKTAGKRQQNKKSRIKKTFTPRLETIGGKKSRNKKTRNYKNKNKKTRINKTRKLKHKK